MDHVTMRLPAVIALLSLNAAFLFAQEDQAADGPTVTTRGRRTEVNYGNRERYSFGTREWSLDSAKPTADGVAATAHGVDRHKMVSLSGTDVKATIPGLIRDYLFEPGAKSANLTGLSFSEVDEQTLHPKESDPDTYIGEAILLDAKEKEVRARFSASFEPSMRPSLLYLTVVAEPEPADAAKPAPQPKADAITPRLLDRVGAAVSKHVTDASQDGAFVLVDPVVGLSRRLRLRKIEHETVAVVDAKHYRVCVDFVETKPEQHALDVDFFLEGGAGGLTVKNALIHKIDGEPRFEYSSKPAGAPTP